MSKYLLREAENLDVNIANSFGKTALHWAVVCSRNRPRGHTKLYVACIEGDVAEMMKLVRVDDDKINAQSNNRLYASTLCLLLYL